VSAPVLAIVDVVEDAFALVHQSTFPSVTAPLGWVLSQESMATMDRGLAEQADPNAPEPTSPVLSVTENRSLRDAIRMARHDSP
jgi:hypothetical protein